MRVLKMCADLWWRLEVPHAQWPYKLLLMVDPLTRPQDQFDIAKQCFDANACDLDPHFTRKLRNIYFGPHDMYADSDLKTLLIAWGREGKLCNMHTERLLASIKQAAPGRSPELERVITCGYMAQMLKAHKKVGGRDPRIMIGKTAVAQGAPPRRGEPTAKRPKKSRAHVLYANEKRQMSMADIKPGKAEMDELMSGWMNGYHGLADAEKQQWVDQVNEAILHEPDAQPEKDSFNIRSGVARGLWNLNDDDFPVKYSALRDTFARYTNSQLQDGVGDYGSEDEFLPGFTAAARYLREDWNKRAVIYGEGCASSEQFKELTE